MGVPPNGWFKMENPIKIRMIWGYPHFRNKALISVLSWWQAYQQQQEHWCWHSKLLLPSCSVLWYWRSCEPEGELMYAIVHCSLVETQIFHVSGAMRFVWNQASWCTLSTMQILVWDVQTTEWPWFACPNREKGANIAKQRILHARPVVVYLCSIPWASVSAALLSVVLQETPRLQTLLGAACLIHLMWFWLQSANQISGLHWWMNKHSRENAL